MQMADEQDRRQDDDVAGHEAARTPDEGRMGAPREAAAAPEDDDDVRGHEAARAPEPGKKDAPGENA
jgi:hypothetical protein